MPDVDISDSGSETSSSPDRMWQPEFMVGFDDDEATTASASLRGGAKPSVLIPPTTSEEIADDIRSMRGANQQGEEEEEMASSPPVPIAPTQRQSRTRPGRKKPQRPDPNGLAAASGTLPSRDLSRPGARPLKRDTPLSVADQAEDQASSRSALPARSFSCPPTQLPANPHSWQPVEVPAHR